MKRSPTWLLEHKRDVYSQTGEDGILEKVLETLPMRDGWCVEFGAWDGMHLTNTRYLIESKDYSAVLIEADTSRFHVLQRNYAGRTNVITLDRIVGYGDSDGLDSILAPLPVPRDFDLLSIDIDGNDYHVWKAISAYQPKVVIIEFNPTIPTDIRFVQVADGTVTQGASLLALVELGKEKGYELVSVLQFNAVFVKKEYFTAFEIESNAPTVLRTDLSSVTYLFSGYDGKIFLRGARRLPWHGIELDESDVQPLPRFLRRHPGLYSLPQKVAFALRHPGRLVEWLRTEGTKRLRK